MSQSYKYLEVILQDGGSKDNTIQIAESYNDPRIKIFQENDKGIYDAMNKGVSKATGEIIGILNSDDAYYDDSVLESIVETFDRNSNLSVTYGNLEYVDMTMTKVVRYWKSREFEKKLFYIAWQPPHPTVYLRRFVYDTIGNFDLKYKIAADFDLMFRLFFMTDLKSQYLDKTIVKMRVGGESNRSWKNRMVLLKEYQSIYSKHGHMLIGPLTIVNRLLSRLSQYKFGIK
jgi:glycosyltransferase